MISYAVGSSQIPFVGRQSQEVSMKDLCLYSSLTWPTFSVILKSVVEDHLGFWYVTVLINIYQRNRTNRVYVTSTQRDLFQGTGWHDYGGCQVPNPHGTWSGWRSTRTCCGAWVKGTAGRTPSVQNLSFCQKAFNWVDKLEGGLLSSVYRFKC